MALELSDILSRLDDSVQDKLAQEAVSSGMSELKKPGIQYPAFQPPPKMEAPPPEPQQAPMINPDVQLSDSQKDFIKFINAKNGIGIAAWKAGAGKTLGTIAAFLDLKQRGKAGKAIVLVPASLRENFAVDGVSKFTNATVGIIGTKQESANPEFDVEQMGDRDFYVISHDMFRENPDYYLQKTGADTIIFDEMHRVKNPQSVLNDVIEKAGSKVANFIGATASPAMNKPFEAIELRNVLSSTEERLSEKQFTKQFIKRAPRDFWERVKGLFGGEQTGEIVGFKQKEKLKKLLGSSYHFASPTVKNMPRKEVETVEVPMTPAQEQTYHNILKAKLTKRERQILEKGELLPDKEMVPILNKIMAIRQLSNNAKWVEGLPAGESAQSSPKILRMVRDAEEHLINEKRGKIIVYSNFVGSGTKLMEASLKASGIPYATYYGKGQKGVSDKKRRKAIEDYRAGKVRILIMSGAGAEGLSLPNTTMHMTMDPHYNPERIVQSEGRGIRKGGQSFRSPENRRVRVLRYVSKPSRGFSVDSSIYQIAAKKKELVDRLKALGLEAQQQRMASDPGRARAVSIFSGKKPKKPEEPRLQKVARGGGYRGARGSLESGEVRLISGKSWTTEPTNAAGGNVFPYLQVQDHLGDGWSTRKKSEAEGKKRKRLRYSNKSKGVIGPNPEKEGLVRIGY